LADWHCRGDNVRWRRRSCGHVLQRPNDEGVCSYSPARSNQRRAIPPISRLVQFPGRYSTAKTTLACLPHRYQHIDALFGDEIDWDLIATHARDMIQVVLSIQAGRVMPSMLLRKLGTYNRKSLLYQAFRELGRVERTLFLLRFISSTEIRRVIRAETTKIETYNEFLDWVCFGGPVVKSGDPVEQEKQLKYASLVANAVRLPRAPRTETVHTPSPLPDGMPSADWKHLEITQTMR
jgi:hypothetical protein